MQPYRAWMANISTRYMFGGLMSMSGMLSQAPITHGTSTYIVPILAHGGCHVILDDAGAEVVRNAFRGTPWHRLFYAAHLGVHAHGIT